MNGWVLDQMSHLRFLIGKSTDRTSRGIRNSLSLGIGCNTAIRNSLMGRAQCVDRYIYQAWYIHHSRMRSFFPLVLPRRRTVICRRSVLVIFAIMPPTNFVELAPSQKRERQRCLRPIQSTVIEARQVNRQVKLIELNLDDD